MVLNRNNGMKSFSIVWYDPTFTCLTRIDEPDITLVTLVNYDHITSYAEDGLIGIDAVEGGSSAGVGAGVLGGDAREDEAALSVVNHPRAHAPAVLRPRQDVRLLQQAVG